MTDFVHIPANSKALTTVKNQVPHFRALDLTELKPPTLIPAFCPKLLHGDEQQPDPLDAVQHFSQQLFVF